MGDRLLRELTKTRPVFPYGVALKHWQHARAGPIDNGDSRQESGSQIERQDRSSRRGQACAFCGDQVIERRNDCAEHPETPELSFIKQRLWHATHQKQSSNIDRGGPGPLVTLRFGVEQSFAMTRSLPILEERGSDFEAARIAETSSA